MKISASFLSIKENLANNILKLDNTTINFLHVDIMDGEFVNNKTLGVEEIKGLLTNTKKPLDVHLMVRNVIKYVNDYETLNPEFITFHFEAVDNPLEIINYIKTHNIKVGMSIKPNTTVKVIEPYLSYLDLILVMSVEPGIGGQQFIKEAVGKINDLGEIRQNNNYDYLIEVDGGINESNIQFCKNADIIVAGSYVTNHYDYQLQIYKLMEKLD